MNNLRQFYHFAIDNLEANVMLHQNFALLYITTPLVYLNRSVVVCVRC